MTTTHLSIYLSIFRRTKTTNIATTQQRSKYMAHYGRCTSSRWTQINNDDDETRFMLSVFNAWAKLLTLVTHCHNESHHQVHTHCKTLSKIAYRRLSPKVILPVYQQVHVCNTNSNALTPSLIKRTFCRRTIAVTLWTACHCLQHQIYPRVQTKH